MLPLLAATLGITVDELLAGDTRAEAEEEPPAQAEPAGLTAARRQFAAEKLAAQTAAAACMLSGGRGLCAR